MDPSPAHDHQFLVRCLRAAIIDPTLVNDIIEACTLSNTTAADLAGWSLEDIANKLFLTPDESVALINVCQAVNRGDIHELVEVEKANAGRAALVTNGYDDPSFYGHDQAAPIYGQSGEGAGNLEEGDFIEDDKIPEGEYNEENMEQFIREDDEQQPFEGLNPNLPAPDDGEHRPNAEDRGTYDGAPSDELVKEEGREQASALPSGNLSSPRRVADKSASEESDVASPELRKSGELFETPQAVSLESRQNDISRKQKRAAMMRPQSVPVKKSTSSRAPDGTPSYLRPTSSHIFRTSQAQPQVEKPMPSPISFNISPDRRRNALSRLLQPTASYMSHVADSRRDRREEREAAEKALSMRRTTALCGLMNSAEGHRVTKVEPFNFRTSTRGSPEPGPSTDEIRMLEARKNEFKRHEVPSYVREPRVVPQIKSTPKTPDQVQKPFQLASLEKREKYQQMRQQRLDQEREARARLAQFHASDTDYKKILTQPESPKPLTPQPVTKASEIKFASEDRVKYNREVLEPLRRSKMAPEEREKLEARERKAAEEQRKAKEALMAKQEERRRNAELMKMPLDEYRKMLSFKASPKPDFSKPFHVDPFKASPVTKPVDMNFTTDKRFGPRMYNHGEDTAYTDLSGNSAFYKSLRISSGPLGRKSFSQSTSCVPAASLRASARFGSKADAPSVGASQVSGEGVALDSNEAGNQGHMNGQPISVT